MSQTRPLRIKLLSTAIGIPFIITLVQLTMEVGNPEGFGYEEYWHWVGAKLAEITVPYFIFAIITVVLSRGIYFMKNWARLILIVTLPVISLWQLLCTPYAAMLSREGLMGWLLWYGIPTGLLAGMLCLPSTWKLFQPHSG